MLFLSTESQLFAKEVNRKPGFMAHQGKFYPLDNGAIFFVPPSAAPRGNTRALASVAPSNTSAKPSRSPSSVKELRILDSGKFFQTEQDFVNYLKQNEPETYDIIAPREQ